MGVDTVERSQGAQAQPPGTSGRIVRRRGLPRGRAVAGGFLVAVAAVGLFAAHRRAEAPPATAYAVVTADVAPGHRLAPDDLALVPMDLPAAQAATAFDGTETLVDAVTTGALVTGQVVAASDVQPTPGPAVAEEISFPIPRSNALAGAVSPGERVDVVATYGSGADAATVTVARDALLIAGESGDGFAASDVLVVRVGVSDPGVALALAHAATQAEVFLVRSPDAEPPDGPYRPPVAPVGDGVPRDG